MGQLWGTLIPLILGGMLVPVQIIITILLIRSPGGARTALAWVGGMTTVRLGQGVIFGLMLNPASREAGSTDRSGVIVSTILLVLAVLLIAMALRQLFTSTDPDDPPPAWIAMTATMAPGKAVLFGAGMVLISPKFWVFTLGAVGAIADSGPGTTASVVYFILFVALSQLAMLFVIGLAVLAPERAATFLGRASDWLGAHNRVIMIVLGFVFGTWFLSKALSGLGLL